MFDNVLLDEQDMDLLTKFKWHITSEGYVARSVYIGMANGKQTVKKVYMHRQLLDAPQNMVVDHINHDKLDNRRSNLRLASVSENQQNRKPNKAAAIPFKGVHKHRDKFRAVITVDKNRHNLGSFDTAEEASAAYGKAATKLQKEYAYV